MESEHKHDHCHVPQVENQDHQHAFVLVGKEQLFGVHMTQYHCEIHKYQVILKLSLPEEIHQEYRALRELNPNDTYVLCNAKNNKNMKEGEVREFCVPDIGAGMVKTFTANIFQGMRPLTPEEIESDEHFFPWARKYAKASIGEFEVTVERVVTYRPFDHIHAMPAYATYLLFGDSKSGETHMTNLQTAALLTSHYEPEVFGTDYDHIMSLAERPDWLNQDAMLESGIVVTTPIVRLSDPQTGLPTIPAVSPFAQGTTIEVLYRGIGPVRRVMAGPTYLYCTVVCNSESLFSEPPSYNNYMNTLPAVPPVFDISSMPKRYWAFADE